METPITKSSQWDFPLPPDGDGYPWDHSGDIRLRFTSANKAQGWMTCQDRFLQWLSVTTGGDL